MGPRPSMERKWKRVGVYGMNFVMPVRDYRELANGSLELVPFDTQFDMTRAVKSEEELAEVRDAMDIILDGFWALVGAYAPGKTEAEIMAPAVERFLRAGPAQDDEHPAFREHGEAEAFLRFRDNGRLRQTISCCIRLKSPVREDIGWNFRGLY